MVNRNHTINGPPCLETRKVHRRKKAKAANLKLLSRGAILAILSSMALLGGCNSSQEVSGQASKTEVTAEATPEVKTHSTQQDIVLSGRAEPFQTYFLSPSISANVKEINAEVGTYVKEGQQLALLDESDLVYRIEQAEAEVMVTEAEARMRAIEQQIQLNQIKVTLSSDSAADLENDIFAVKEAKMAHEEALKNWERTDALFKQGAITQVEMEKVNKAKIQAEDNLKKAEQILLVNTPKVKEQKQSAIAIAKLQKESIHTSAKLTEMGVEKAKADLEIIRYQHNNLLVTAPINGFITDTKAVVGESVSPANPMFVITNLDKLSVQVGVPEAMINRLEMGQKATVTIPTIGKTVEGKVSYIALLADSDSQTFPVKVLIDNLDHEIKGGMQAQVTISMK
jgi:HlyD family secretion protein